MSDQKPLAHAKSNPKHKREVCRYWLNSRCQKGFECEFLHTLDLDKMPVCPRGLECYIEDCNFKHPTEAKRVCANYQMGFCSFGNRCAHSHVQETTAPHISPYWTQDDVNKNYAGLVPSSDKNWRKKKCDYFVANGWCPYFDMCNFVH